MRVSPKWGWFAAFTAVFAVCAAVVFWGSWGPNMGFVAPDDGIFFSYSYDDTVRNWWNMFSTTGKAHPLDLLWSGLVSSPLACSQLKYIVPVFLAGVALAWFLRGRGLSRLSSYGAGVLFSFCGYSFTLFSAGHGNWFVWLGYGVFAFGLVDRAVAGLGMSYWALLGLVEAWGSFYVPDVWLLFAAFLGAYLLFRSVSCRAFSFKGVLLAAAVFLSVGAPSIYSAFVNDLSSRDSQIDATKDSPLAGGKSEDADARWIFVTNWSLPPNETLEFFMPRINGDTSCPLTLSIGRQLGTGVKPYTGALGRPYGADSGNYRQHSLYVGFVTCLLALLAVVALFMRIDWTRDDGCEASGACEPRTANREPRATILFFAVAAVVFWLFSLGRYCEPVYRFVYALPFGDYLRAPVKWHHLTEFSLCVLAGYGIEAALSLAARWRFSRVAVSAVVVLGVLNLAYVAHLYCAPIDYSRAVSMKCSSRLTVMPRQQFSQPQVAEMMRRSYIVPVANWLGGAEAVLVQALEPARSPKPVPIKTVPFCLGLVSVVSAIAVAVVALKSKWRVET